MIAVALTTFLAIAAGSSCETTSDPSVFEKADLLGVVYDGSAKPVQGFNVILDGKVTAVSDLNGHFSITNVARGTHDIQAKKTGFEAFETSFDFLQKSQILYMTIHSLQDYLQDADVALAKKDFALTAANLERAASIDPKNPIVLYMKAVLSATVGSYNDAMSQLDTLISLGIKDEPVYLLRLDIAIVEKSFADKVIGEIQADPLLRLNPRISKKLDALQGKKD